MTPAQPYDTTVEPAHLDEQAGTRPRSGKLFALVAQFDSTDSLKHACDSMRKAGYSRWDAHSPFPVHGIDEHIGIKMTLLPKIVAVAGIVGCATGLALQWYANATGYKDFPGIPTFVQGYDLLVSGKPYFSLPANIPVLFELTVLFSALTAGIGMLALNNLPLFYNPLFNSRQLKRATTDGFFISVEAADRRFDPVETERLLSSLGGVVERVDEYESEARFPGWIRTLGLLLLVILPIPLLVIAMMRNAKSSQPRIHIIQDMDNQPRYKAQQASPIFADGRASRMPVGATPEMPLGTTVARGELREDDHFYTGIVHGDYVTTFPSGHPDVQINETFLARGQQRFDVYCAPCHGWDGTGNGPVSVRIAESGDRIPKTWVPPLNLLDAEIRARPHGHIFNTITRGIRTMPAYGDQIPEADRWAIVAYVRALQRSGASTADDVPPEKRAELESSR